MRTYPWALKVYVEEKKNIFCDFSLLQRTQTILSFSSE